MSSFYCQIPLPGGVVVNIIDLTRIYFGDYYLVKLEIRCEIPSPEPTVLAGAESSAARTCPDRLTYVRHLQKMGVASNEVEMVKLALVNDFETNSLPYLLSADFPAKLLASRQTAVPKTVKTYMEKM